MIAIIQCITTEWTKASRGAPKSAQRAAIPDRFPLPPTTLPERAKRIVVLHQIKAAEREDFTLYQQCEASELCGKPELVRDPVTVGFEEGLLRVKYRPGIWSVGAPDRTGKGRNVFNLAPGQWGRLAFNGRFGYGLEWRYHRRVFNIACSLEIPDRELFLGEADFAVSDEQDLS